MSKTLGLSGERQMTTQEQVALNPDLIGANRCLSAWTSTLNPFPKYAMDLSIHSE